MKRYGTIILLIALLCLGACGKTLTTGEHSPQLESAAITSYHDRDEKHQFVQVSLEFDRAISIPAEDRGTLRVTISGERMRDYTLELGTNDRTALLTIPVEAVTSGVLYIGKAPGADVIADICSGDGIAAAADFTIEGIIPSGVTLETAASEAGCVVKEVVSSWNIRSIAWVGLWEDGVLIPVSETRSGEELEGYAAVHGHEFLIENETDVAEKIAQTLTQNYDDTYNFSWEGTQVTARRPGSDAALDICVYQYLEINGQRQESERESVEASQVESPASEPEQVHESGSKVKTAEENRTVQVEEQAFLDRLHTAGAVQDSAELYDTLTVTGAAFSETQIYSVRDLEELIRLSFVNSNMNELGLSAAEAGYYGLDVITFLALCGVDTGADVTVLCKTADGGETALPIAQFTGALLALADENGPLSADGAGPICLILTRDETTQQIENLNQLTIGPGAEPVDPGYGYHDRDPYLESEELAFTVEVYQSGAEYLGAIKTVSYTTAELEALMQKYPERVVSGYYGTIGSTESFQYEGVGGWLDHFEGLELCWLLTDQAGIETLSGRAELYDRDGVLYSQIDDLSYLTLAQQEPQEYYVMTSDGLKITGMVPMVATVKNGAPILPDHAHDGAGYLAYNTLNDNLEDIGVSTEVGVVKNHNGPFVACLGNRDGFYGGPEVETGNNCVIMRLYLN